jgi:tetratricopeptide (TPR) repeat protein
MTQSIQNLLTLAREQMQRGQLQDSEESYRRVVTSGQFVAQGLYGIGIVRNKLNDQAGAKYYLLQALQQDPSYADTHYQLGLIAQQEHSWEEARSYFRKAISIDPQHHLAQQALSQLPGGVVQAEQAPFQPYIPQLNQPGFNGPDFASSQDDPYNMPTLSNLISQPPSILSNYGGYQARNTSQQEQVAAGQVANSYVQPQQYGAYDFLRDDPSRRAQNTLAVIDALRIKGHPSVSAYLSSFIPGIFGFILLIAFAIALSLLSTGALDKNITLVVVVILGLSAIWGLFAMFKSLVRYLQVVTTEYKIDQGRLQITKGIFGKETITYELLRVHNIEFKQSFANRLTGDGTLIFRIENEPEPLVIKGLVKGKKLQEIYQQFLNLVALLRLNPSAKGFIQ